MARRSDPLCIPGIPESLEITLARLEPLASSAGASYVERRGIPLAVAEDAGLRFSPNFAGRPAVVQPLYDSENQLVSLHARYLAYLRGHEKMFTIGPGGGTVNVAGGWRANPLMVVEGLFDALSLGACGFACVATIGRWVPWLREASAGRAVWLALDAGRSGEKEVARYTAFLCQSQVKRILPPERDKDWNTALVKRGRATVTTWVERQLERA